MMHQPAHVIGFFFFFLIACDRLDRTGRGESFTKRSGFRQARQAVQSIIGTSDSHTPSVSTFFSPENGIAPQHRSLHGTTALFYISIKIIQRDLSAICNLGKEIHRQHYNTIQRHQFIICSTIIILNKQ